MSLFIVLFCFHIVSDESDEEFQPAKGIRSKHGTTDSRRLSESIFSDATSLEGSITSTASSATFLR